MVKPLERAISRGWANAGDVRDPSDSVSFGGMSRSGLEPFCEIVNLAVGRRPCYSEHSGKCRKTSTGEEGHCKEGCSQNDGQKGRETVVLGDCSANNHGNSNVDNDRYNASDNDTDTDDHNNDTNHFDHRSTRAGHNESPADNNFCV